MAASLAVLAAADKETRSPTLEKAGEKRCVSTRKFQTSFLGDILLLDVRSRPWTSDLSVMFSSLT